jgi:hypothetical protein
MSILAFAAFTASFVALFVQSCTTLRAGPRTKPRAA